MSKLNELEIEKAAVDSIGNAYALRKHENVGCFHCLEVFAYKQIKTFVDCGQTAVCPHCSVDAILPITCKQELEEIRSYWFAEET